VSSPLMAQDTINQTDKTGKKQGYWTKSYPTGNPVYEGYFKDDKPVGLMKRYFEEGDLKAKMFFKDDGSSEATIFYQNGNKAAQGNFNAQNQKTGTWQYYSYYNKNIKSEESYIEGKKHGEEKKFFDDGTTSEIISWNMGQKDGPWIQYFPSGETKLEANYQDNKLEGAFKIYRPDGKIEILGYYKNNLREGTWQFFDKNGNLRMKLEYIAGIPQNTEKLDKQQKKYFEELEKNIGKYSEPTVEDIFR
jgi:antitoxin component YwqK of YwqJK toxin-antitoxin module